MTAQSEPRFYFGITLKSRQVCADWDETQSVLRRTVRSIRAQGPEARILIACHEQPRLDDERNVTFLPVNFPVPKTIEEKKRDQFAKFFILGMHLKTLGGGYFMSMDYDDLVSRNLLRYVRANLHENGYIFSYGWVLDVGSGVIFPLPYQAAGDGKLKRLMARHLLAMSYRFDLACGSCAMFAFSSAELPSYPHEPCRFTTIFSNGHHRWLDLSVELRRPVAIPPHRFITYVAGLRGCNSLEAGENVNIGAARRGPLRRFLAGSAVTLGFREEFAL